MLTVVKIAFKVIAYIFLIWLALAVAVMTHEWTHGLFAWIFGYKSNPFDIYYGGWSAGNLLLFTNIDQAVNDYAIALIGHPLESAVILIVPPIIINGGYTLLFMKLLRKNLQKSDPSKLWLWFLYWSLLWNFGEFFSYTCLRSFSTHADVGLFLEYTNLSPWAIFVPGLYLCLYGFHRILGHYKTLTFQRIDLNCFWWWFISILSISLLAILEPIRFMNSNFDPIVNFITILTLMAVPWLLWRYCYRTFENESVKLSAETG
jgi:hypothetical protein